MSKKITSAGRGRTIALLLALAMFICMFPIAVSAGDAKLEEVSADWKNFRNSDYNNGVTDAKTPINPDTATLLWNLKLGNGWSASPSVQIIVDNALIVMSGKEIYKLDLQTGETIASAPMVAAPSWGYTPPTYAEGMIFCPLSGGIIQAFNAKTLESVWVYTDELGGQSNSPITYSDGCIYTGFWKTEVTEANYVCINVEDGTPEWTFKHLGGFYWAGSVAVGDAVIVGSDNGENTYNDEGKLNTASSYLYSLDKKTGEIISEIELTDAGDQRSSITYVPEKGKVYFSTKCGYLCSASVDPKTGELSELKMVNYNAQSTGAPVVYDNKVYFAMGSGIKASGSSGNFIVGDADTLEMLFFVPLKGYPQGSTLLSTAYEDTGYLYCYSTYNNIPGGVTMIKIKTDAKTAADAEAIEIYDAAGFENYCITSIICGKDGTLYYKNDSSNVFAVGVRELIADGLTVDPSEGEAKWDKEFTPSVSDYEIVLSKTAETYDLTVEKNADFTAELSLKDSALSRAVNTASSEVIDETDTSTTWRITLPDSGKVTAEVVLSNGADTRSYTLNVRRIADESALGALEASTSNAYGESNIALNTEFDSAVYDYTIDVTNLSNKFYNIWPTATDANSTVKVTAVENIDASRMNSDGTIDVTAANADHDRYAIYPADLTKTAKIQIEVTAEDGITKTVYNVSFVKNEVTDNKTPDTTVPNETTPTVKPTNPETGKPGNDSVNTMDNTPIMLAVTATGVSAVGIYLTAKKRARFGNQEK